MNKLTKHTRVLLRADANAAIGHGHLMRLMALADVLSPHFRCYIVTHGLPAVFHAQLEQLSIELLAIDHFHHVQEEADYLVQHIIRPNDLFVLDGYQFNSAYQETVRETSARLVCLDDLHTQYFHADVVINPAGGLSFSQYKTAIYTRLALGPAYALLRKPFRNLSPRTITSLRHVLICFGGSDQHNLTLKAARAALKIPQLHEIHLVTGASYQHHDTLKALAEAHPDRIFIHQHLSAEAMVQLMLHCQLSIAPASTISYELCSTGIGLITGTSADNQQNIARFLAHQGCAVDIGDFHQITENQLADTLQALTQQQVSEQLRQQQQTFRSDTSSLVKIFQQLAMEKTIRYRRAAQQDLMTYFAWANEQETRLQAVHPEEILLEAHTVWFMKKLASPTDFMFIFEQEDLVGQVRFDQSEDQYVISYSIDKHHRGKGLGTVLIKMALEALQKELGRKPAVVAYVKPANTASLKIFEQNSFTHTGREKIHEIVLEKFVK